MIELNNLNIGENMEEQKQSKEDNLWLQIINNELQIEDMNNGNV